MGLTIWSFACFFILLAGMLNSKTFQHFTIAQSLSYMQEQMGNTIRFDKISYSFPNQVHIHKLFISDQKGDTLFWIHSLKVSLLQINQKQHRVGFAKAKLENAVVNFGYYNPEEKSNFHFFIKFFNPAPIDTTKPRVDWTIAFKQIELVNCKFKWFMKESKAPDYMAFNPSDMVFDSIQGIFQNFKVIGDSLVFDVKKLQSVEKSGFKITNFDAKARIHSAGMEFKRLKLQTPNSTLSHYIGFDYENWSSMSNFIEEVKMEADFTNSYLSFKDLVFFGNAIEPLSHLGFNIEAEASGTIPRIKVRNANLSTLQNTNIKGRFDIRGLPDVDNTYLSFDIEELHSSINELAILLEKPQIAEYSRLNSITYKGKLNGFYNNFVAFGSIKTDAGLLKTDINLDFTSGISSASYSGSLQSNDLNFGTLLGNSSFGKTALSVKLKDGIGLGSESFSFKVEGEVPKFEYSGYTYKKTKLTGEFSNKFFQGLVSIQDPNFFVDFDGLVNLEKGFEQTDFKASIGKINLKSLGIDSVESGLSGFISMKTQGVDIDNLTGQIDAWSLLLVRNTHSVRVEDFHLNSTIQESINKRKISLQSPFLDGELEGEFFLKDLPADFMAFFSSILPGLIAPPEKSSTEENLSFDFRIKDINPVIALFNPEIKLGKGKLTGAFNSVNKELEVFSNISELNISGVELRPLAFQVSKQKNKNLQFSLQSGLHFGHSRFDADTFLLKANVKENFAILSVSASDASEDLKFNSNATLDFSNKGKYLLSFSDLWANIKGKDWYLRDSSQMEFGDYFVLNPMELHSGEESIRISVLNPSINRTSVLFNFSKFELGLVNGFTPAEYPQFNGLANGGVNLFFEDSKLKFESDFSIYELVLNKDTIGSVDIQSRSINSYSNEIQANITSGLFSGLKVFGTMGDKISQESLDLTLDMPRAEMAVFNSFVPGVSKLKGPANGYVLVRGSLRKPDLNGKLFLNKVQFVVDYLQVPFTVDSEIEIKNNVLNIGSTSTIKDDFNSTGVLSGKITHQEFKKWYFDVRVQQLKEFHVLATEKHHNDLFYGQGFADGSAHFYGDLDKMNMVIQAQTTRKTNIKMPIGDSEAAGPAPYIHFKTVAKIDSAKVSSDMGFLNSLQMDIEVTPLAEIQLIFDEQTGDIIKGSGSGKLNFALNSAGDFTMRGGIRVERGEYQFVAFNNLVNKKFYIERGGTILWEGDPLQAKIDLLTYNLQNASPKPLLATSTNNNTNATSSLVQARSEIKLKGNLFSPEISFGVDIQNLMEVGLSELSGVMQRIKREPDEVNRQVFSLLVFGSFMTPTFITNQAGLGSGGNAFNTGLADLVSNQVDAWLSQINPKWLIDFSMSSSNANQRSDMVFKLGRKFYNDRIIVDGSIGTSALGQANNSLNMEYVATPDGRLRVKAFTRTAAIYNNVSAAIAPVNTIGLGLFYRKEFDYILKKDTVYSMEPAKDSTVLENPIDSNQIISNKDARLKKQDSKIRRKKLSSFFVPEQSNLRKQVYFVETRKRKFLV